MLKELIKKLSAEQIELKKARKTGTYDSKSIHNSWDYASIPEKIRNSWKAAEQVRDNAIKITAALNLYHEIRGSDYRHGVKNKWYYDKELADLRTKLASTNTPGIVST